MRDEHAPDTLFVLGVAGENLGDRRRGDPIVVDQRGRRLGALLRGDAGAKVVLENVEVGQVDAAVAVQIPVAPAGVRRIESPFQPVEVG